MRSQCYACFSLIDEQDSAWSFVDKMVAAVDNIAAVEAFELDGSVSPGVFANHGVGRFKTWVFVLLCSVDVTLLWKATIMQSEDKYNAAVARLS